MSAAHHTHRAAVDAFVTKDGSEIRELMHPRTHAARHQSLAEAIVPAGSRTTLHRHAKSEEVYHIVSGAGEMTLGDATFHVERHDTVVIPPGTSHRISNEGGRLPLVLLCACAPAYSDEDTELLE